MTSTLTFPEPYASATVHGIAGWYTSEDPPPQEFVGQRLIVVAGPGEPTYEPEGFELGWVLNGADLDAPARYRLSPEDGWPGFDLHPGCIVGAVTLADVVLVRAVETFPEGADLDYNHIFTCPQDPLTERREPGLWTHVVSDGGRLDRWSIRDQLPWADWSPGRWAWRFENPEPITEACPYCFLLGVPIPDKPGIYDWDATCPVCNNERACSPIPYPASEGLAEFDPGRLR